MTLSLKILLPEIVPILNQSFHLLLAILFSGTVRAVVLEVHIRLAMSTARATASDNKVIKNRRQHSCHVGNSDVSITGYLELIHVRREKTIVCCYALVASTCFW